MSRRTKEPLTEQIKQSAKAPAKKKAQSFQILPSGSTLLNLACADSSDGAFKAGSIINIIGDSSSGKTFACLTALAESAIRKDFDSYHLIYDDAEHRNSFDMEYLFGKEIAQRIQPPDGFDTDKKPINSSTIEDFQNHIYKLLKKEIPFIYILDSMDSLDAEADIQKFEKKMNAKKEEKVAGNYGMAKAKANSELLRRICGMIEKTESLLIVISQTRDNIGIGFAEKTRSGGRALKFYSTHECWMAVVKTLKKGSRPIGVRTRIKIKNNSITGKIREVEFPIYYDYGIDDIGSCLEFLIKEEKIEQNSKQTYSILGHSGTIPSLIKKIEHYNLEKDLRNLTEQAWHEIEEDLKLKRKPKYE